MSSTSVLMEGLPHAARSTAVHPRGFRVLTTGTIFAAVASLIGSYMLDPASVTGPGWRLIPWIVAVTLADLGAIQVSRGLQLTFAYPLLLGAAFLFSPAACGIVAFVGSVDLREVRREISLEHAMFNRGQIALSVMAASVVFHTAGGVTAMWPLVFLPALLALGTDAVVNALFAGAGARLQHDASWSVFEGWVAMGRPLYFALTYTLYGLSAVLFREFHLRYGTWSFLAFVIPLALGHEVFSHALRLRTVGLQLMQKEQALEAAAKSIAEERRDERTKVAGNLHDEVLQPLHHVHLMGEVLRHDLSSGRLLDLENDLPELLKATELAASSIRQLIKELRSTSMGRGGLTSTVALLVEQVASETRIKIDSVLEDVGGSPQTQLLIYQVAREGIGNAVKHASAARLFIALTIVERRIRLIVEDDGKGFVAGEVDGDKHFGLQLMRERVDMAGGTFSLESTPGGGTKIVAEFPADVAF